MIDSNCESETEDSSVSTVASVVNMKMGLMGKKPKGSKQERGSAKLQLVKSKLLKTLRINC